MNGLGEHREGYDDETSPAVHFLDTEPGHPREIEILEDPGGEWSRFVEVLEPGPDYPALGLSFQVNGIELTAADFPRTLEGWVAFSIAFAAATHCKDKAAALTLLRHEARGLMQRVRADGGGS